MVPEEIVLGDSYSVKTGFFCFVNQVLGGRRLSSEYREVWLWRSISIASGLFSDSQ